MNYERIAAGLQKRLADTVSRYEGDLAILQEQATEEIERLQARVSELEGEKKDELVAQPVEAEVSTDPADD